MARISRRAWPIHKADPSGLAVRQKPNASADGCLSHALTVLFAVLFDLITGINGTVILFLDQWFSYL